ncbi:hypothetical protein LIER_26627 [Lithospermum erythrorhizon]|uniref:Uncharacterized protein n=1 Tax=Lithospermum erythrorhizon TaxID=34254 RepID=A0AAV3R924_LITER
MMADFSKKRADEAAQKLKEVEEAVLGRIQEGSSRLQSSNTSYEEEWFTNYNLDAPLTPEDEGEEENFPGDIVPIS